MFGEAWSPMSVPDLAPDDDDDDCYTLYCCTSICYTLFCYTLYCYTLYCFPSICYTSICYTSACWLLHNYVKNTLCHIILSSLYEASKRKVLTQRANTLTEMVLILILHRIFWEYVISIQFKKIIGAVAKNGQLLQSATFLRDPARPLWSGWTVRKLNKRQGC